MKEDRSPTLLTVLILLLLLMTIAHLRARQPGEEAQKQTGAVSAPTFAATLMAYEAPAMTVSEPGPPVVEIDEALVEPLAIVIYREAGGDSCCDLCRRRVGDVALNRVESEKFPDTLCEVLTQKYQYGTMYWDGVVWPERAKNPKEAAAVDRARRIAREILSGQHSDLYGAGYVFQSEFPDLGHDTITCCGIYFAKG